MVSRGKFFHQVICKQFNAAQRIPDLVPQLCRKLAYGGQMLIEFKLLLKET